MNRNIVGMYRDRAAAQAVVRDLVEAGVSPDRIGLSTQDPVNRYRELARVSDRRRERAGIRGAVAGAVLGALIGAAVALILAFLPVPGILLGPSLVLSIVACAVIGAILGGIVGWFAGANNRRNVPIPSRHPELRALRQHGTVVAAEVEPRQVRPLTRLMDRHRPLDLDRGARPWRGRSGWAPALETRVHEALADTSVGDQLVHDVGRGRDLDRERGYGPQGMQREPGTELGDRGREAHGREGEIGEHREPGIGERREPGIGERAPFVGRATRRRERHEERREERRISGTREDWDPEAMRMFEPRFHQHFDATYGGRERWELHRDAYELGLRLAWDARARQRLPMFSDVEGLARMRWESGPHADVPFHRVRDAIAYGFEEGRLSYA